MKHFFRSIVILVWKDILIDFRRKEHLLSMFFFSVVTLLIFYFAMGDRPRLFQAIVPGIIGVTFLLAGVLGLSKSFTQEIENGCLGGLLLTPVDRGTLFLGKMLGTLFFLFILQILVIPLCLLFFDISVNNWNLLLLALVAGTVGFSALGTLLAAMTASLKGKEVLLPMLLFPLILPNLISVVKITSSILLKSNLDSLSPWWKLFIGFDVVFTVAAYLGFEFIIEE